MTDAQLLQAREQLAEPIHSGERALHSQLGDIRVSAITLPLLAETWTKPPPANGEVRVRADAAFFDRKIIDALEARRASPTPSSGA